LSEHVPDIQSKGVNVAAVLYDSPVMLARFSVKYGITFPLLSDPESSAIIQLGLLNPTYDPSTKYYGVPYPGVFLVDSKGIIIGKFAEENYRDRPLMEDLIRAVNELD
jgi:peroxiredoxin